MTLEEAVAPKSVESLIPAARRIAARYVQQCRYEEFEDLVQQAMIGFVMAADKYDRSKGKFTTYGWSIAIGEVRHYVRDKIGLFNRPRMYVDDDGKRRESVSRALTLWSIESVDDETGMSIADDLADERSLEAFDVVDILASARRSRSGRMIRLYRDDVLRYIAYMVMKGLTQNEMAKRLGVSQRQVCRLIKLIDVGEETRKVSLRCDD